MKCVPLMPNCSPTARAPGTTAHPGCDCEGECESSVSSAWASTPFASAASIAPHESFEATTADIGLPPYASTNWSDRWPGSNFEPEIIAAKVSRICCFVFSATSSGRARVAASLI
jgi:hypothetical protein